MTFCDKKDREISLRLPLQHTNFVQSQSAWNFIIFLLVLGLSNTIKKGFVPEDFCLVMHIIFRKKSLKKSLLTLDWL